MSSHYDSQFDDPDDERDYLESELHGRDDDPNQCPECGDNLDEFEKCASCDY